MLEILKAILFGIVEGVTEWLPISSTGHMILLDEFIHLGVSEEFYKLFEVVNKIKGEKLVLGRNNKDIRKSMSILKGRKDIKIMTVHKSKGLEADNVILVGLDDSILGFPNKIIQNNILKYVLSDKDNYPYEEERRLFYVALTRTKNDVYLLVNKNNPSIFVKELLKDYSNYIKID